MKKEKNKGQNALAIVQSYFGGVKRVDDATKAIDVEVTAQDSSDSIALDHAKCALAVACKREMQADGVIIGIKVAYIIRGHRALRYLLLESAAREIVSFDRKAGFAGGTYRLRPPSASAQLGAGRKMGSRTITGTKRRLMHFTANIRTRLTT